MIRLPLTTSKIENSYKKLKVDGKKIKLNHHLFEVYLTITMEQK